MNTTPQIHNAAAQSADSLTKSWLAFYREPGNRRLLEAFTAELDREVRRRLPDDTLGGILGGEEAVIRSLALEMLSTKLLHGNRELLLSTEAGVIQQVETELHRSVGAAVQISIRRTAREISRHNRRLVPYDQIPESGYLPIVSVGLACLPVDKCLAVLATALERAVSAGVISERDARLVHNVTTHGERVAEVASRLNISRTLVYRRIRAVAPLVRSFIDRAEVPFQ